MVLLNCCRLQPSAITFHLIAAPKRRSSDQNQTLRICQWLLLPSGSSLHKCTCLGDACLGHPGRQSSDCPVRTKGQGLGTNVGNFNTLAFVGIGEPVEKLHHQQQSAAVSQCVEITQISQLSPARNFCISAPTKARMRRSSLSLSLNFELQI